MKNLLSVVETIWNLGILLMSLSCFGGFAALTYKLGESALNLHQKGLISLVALNCALQGEKLPESCKAFRKTKGPSGK